VGTVASLLVAPLMVSSTPPVVVGAYGFLLLLASLRLLVPLVDTELRRVLYGLAAWYALDRLRDRLVPDPIASRLLVLATACLAVAILAWLLRPARIGKLGQLTQRPGWLRAIGLGTRVVLLLNAAAVVSGVIGNTTLAEVLVEGSVASAWYAFTLFALSRILGGVWALLLRSDPARALRMVRNHGSLLRRRGRTLIQTALVLGWAWLTLDGFDIAVPVFASVSSALDAQWKAGELTISLGGILSFALMVAASVAVSRLVRFVLEEDVLSRASLPRGVPFAISTLARYAILLLGFAMAMAAAGLDVGRLTLLFGALGVGIGIGLQDIVNNFVSGLILLFERPVQVGDLVDVGTVRGEVRRIGIRSSTVRTLEGAEVVIPNSKLVSDSFVNWTLSDRQRRIEIPVGVGYGSDPDRVIEILEAVVRDRPEVLREPPPDVLFERLGESSLEFLVRAWAADFDGSRVLRSHLTGDILRALREAGIEIHFPQRSLHLRSVDASVRQVAAAGAPETGPSVPPGAARGGLPAAEDPKPPPAAATRPG
jgi:potassium efflux system protein